MEAPKRIWCDDLALALIAGWVNCPVEKMPKEMRAHTCEATAIAWGRVADAARSHLATEHARIVAEKDARIADLEGSLRVIAETEWLEVEPGGNWKPEGSEAYVEEMEAFCHWAIVFSKAALARAALKGEDNG